MFLVINIDAFGLILTILKHHICINYIIYY